MHWFMDAHNPSVYRIGTIRKNCIRRCETDGLPTDFRSDAATLYIMWSFWFWLFSCENIILIWCQFIISTFLYRFSAQRRHRWFSSLYVCWNALFCMTNGSTHIFQKLKSCHDTSFIKRKQNECVSRLYNSFLWIFYKSTNLCRLKNQLLWLLFSICQSIPASGRWKTNITRIT